MVCSVSILRFAKVRQIDASRRDKRKNVLMSCEIRFWRRAVCRGRQKNPMPLLKAVRNSAKQTLKIAPAHTPAMSHDPSIPESFTSLQPALA